MLYTGACDAYYVVHGDLNVSRDYVVPEGDSRFPSETRGMLLGWALANMKAGNTTSKHASI